MISRREFISLALVGAGGMAVAGCAAQGSDGSSQSQSQQSVGNGTGHDPSAVVALTKSVCGMWLDAGGTVVGATDDAIQDLNLTDVTSVGTLYKPSKEAIVGLNPTLVLLSEDVAVQKQLAQDLQSSGVDVIDETINSFEDYDTAMQGLCDITGRSDLYDQNVAQVGQHIEDVRQKVQDNEASRQERTYLCLRVSAAKNKALKKDNFACEILSDMALSNVADDSSSLDDLSLEAIVSANPTYIFVVTQGDQDQAQQAYQDAFASQAVWQQLDAVQGNRVYQLPEDLFHYKPNERWGEAYDYVYQLIYG